MSGVDDGPFEGDPPARSSFDISDEALAAQLRATRCEGLLWMITAPMFAGYAERVLRSLIRNGRINRRMLELKLKGAVLHDDELDSLGSERAELDDLVAAALGDGMVKFRDRGLLGDEWSPEGGASLTTYCANTVITCLPSAIRRWRVNTGRRNRLLADDIFDLEQLGRLPVPGDDDDAATLRLLEICNGADPRLRKILQYMLEHDCTLREAADQCGVAPRTAYRLRQQLREEQRRRDHPEPREQEDESS